MLARDALAGDEVNEPLRRPCDERDAGGRCRRRNEPDHLEAVGPVAKLGVAAGFVRRQVEHQYAVHPRRRGGVQKALEAERVNRVQVSIEYHGEAEALRAQIADATQHARDRGAGRQGASSGRLVDRAVCQWIGKRHAKLQDVHARRLQRERQTVRLREVGITGGKVGDESLFTGRAQAGKGFVDAVGGSGGG